MMPGEPAAGAVTGDGDDRMVKAIWLFLVLRTDDPATGEPDELVQALFDIDEALAFVEPAAWEAGVDLDDGFLERLEISRERISALLTEIKGAPGPTMVRSPSGVGYDRVAIAQVADLEYRWLAEAFALWGELRSRWAGVERRHGGVDATAMLEGIVRLGWGPDQQVIADAVMATNYGPLTLTADQDAAYRRFVAAYVAAAGGTGLDVFGHVGGSGGV